MALSPVISGRALPLGRAWRSWRKTSPVAAPIDLLNDVPGAHVVVGGYGRSGKAVAHVLQTAGIPLVTVELNHSVFSDMTGTGLTGIWGDITGEELLRAAKIESARILLLTIPDTSTIRLCVERARLLNPEIVVIARAAREHHVAELRKMGVNAVVQAEFEGGVEMVRQAMVRYQCDEATTSRMVSAVRAEFYGGAVG
jgi:CPA2 family monovalent cation:H+ antiporter-2